MKERESAKAREVAREYKKKGFEVTLHPEADQLPEILQSIGFRPDILALSDTLNLVIEVRTAETIQDESLPAAAAGVNELDGWQFELIYTNPKRPATLPDAANPVSLNPKAQLDRATALWRSEIGPTYPDAVLLLAWAAIENRLRTALQTPIGVATDVQTVIRDSVIHGILDQEQYQFLEKISLLREQISHGLGEASIEKDDVERLILLGEEIISEIDGSFSVQN